MLFRDPTALQIKVTLEAIEPAVWRRLIVPLPWRLDQLHLAIQAAFNWWNAHLHEFRIGGLRYGDLEIDEMIDTDGPRLFDERSVTLRDFDREPGLAFTYVYDFGDDWRHIVEFEELLALEPDPRLAVCTDGARARPPEDVGGVSGYQRFLQIIADPFHPEHGDTRRWCGGHFDPDWFDLALVDKDVRNALRPSLRRRLHQTKPKRSAAKR